MKNVKQTYQHLAVIVILLTITLTLYRPVLEFSLLNYDDNTYIYNNPDIRSFSKENVAKWFGRMYDGNYFPVTLATYAIDYHISGISPKTYHTTNLLLHLLTAITLYVLIYGLSNRITWAFPSALLFAIHPINTEVVAWVGARNNILYTLFFIASLYCYVLFLKKSKLVFYMACLLCFGISVCSKLAAITLPLFLFLLDYYYDKKFSTRQLLSKLPFIALSIAGFLLLQHTVAARDLFSRTGNNYAGFDHMIMSVHSFMFYVHQSVVPLHLSVFHPYPLSFLPLAGGALLSVVLLPVIVAICAIVAWKKSLKERKHLMLGGLFFVFGIALSVKLIAIGDSLVCERYAYLPAIGLFFVAGFFFAMGWQKRGIYRIATAVAYLIWTAFLARQTCGQLPAWQNNQTFFGAMVRQQPHFSYGYLGLGVALAEAGEPDEAIEVFSQGLALDTTEVRLYTNRGHAYFMRDKNRLSLDDYQRAATLDPGNIDAQTGIGLSLFRMGETQQALQALEKALKADPNNPSSLFNLGLVYYKTNQTDRACQVWRNAEEIQPGIALYHLNLYCQP